MSESTHHEKEIFNEALELKSPEKRAAFLEGACGQDGTLRERIEALLKTFESLEGFLPTRNAKEVNTVLDTSSSESPGSVIGRYKLREKIGEGGCGVVYVAEQEEPVRRRVALKVIKLGMDTRSVVARFEAERQALAMMDHPNIAKVLDAGATENGRPYFVMELVRGIKITDYCDQNKLSTRQRLDLFIQVCNAVQHAHQKGIIHRDLKPSNILVTLHDGVPVPKVIDFGIAKATEGRLTDLTVYTELHQFIGTPAYMSPEQAEMSGLDIDTRSDIYSLGVLLYELLTGRTPFDAKALLAAGLDEIRRTIREVEPPRPSTRLSTLANGDLTTVARARDSEPPKLVHLIRCDLDWIVMKALEKDRTRRYETANGFAMDLKRYLSNEPVTARPPSQLYRFQKLVRRNRLAFAAGAAVILALIGGFGFSTWSFLMERKAKAEAVIAQRNEATERQRAQEQEQIAVEQRKAAEDRARELRRHSCVTDMGLAWQALQNEQVGRARELVEKYLHRQPGEEDLRGFEWRLLWQRSLANYEHSFNAHRDRATCAVFSPDGALLSTAGEDKTVIVWDWATKKRLKTFERFDGGIDTKALAFSPNGRLLAAKGDTLLRVWTTDNWQEIATLTDVEPNDNRNNAVVFSPDGSTLATRAMSGPARGVTFWNTATWQKTTPFLRDARFGRGGKYSVLGTVMAYSKDARFLAVSDWQELQIRDARQPANLITNLARLPADEDSRVLSVAFSDKYVAASYRDGIAVLWEWRTWEQKASVKTTPSYLTALAFSPDSSLLLTGSSHVIRVWDVETLVGESGRNEVIRPRTSFRGHTAGAMDVVVAPDGHTVASASADGTVKLWNLLTDSDQANLPGSTDAVAGFSSDGQTFAAIHTDGRLHFWDVQRRSDLGPVGLDPIDTSVKTKSPKAVALAPSGQQLAVALTNGQIQLWRLSSPPVLSRVFVGDGNGIHNLGFSPEPRPQRLVATTRTHSDSYAYWLHDPRGDAPSRLFHTVTRRALWSAQSFAFSPDGNLLAVINSADGLTLFNFSDGSNRRVGEGSEPFRCVAFSPDGSLLAASVATKHTVLIWEVGSQRGPWILKTSAMELGSLAFGPDSKTLLTWDFDNTIRFWNVALRKEMFAIANFRPGGLCLSFSPRGNALALHTSRNLEKFGNIELYTVPTLEKIDGAERSKIGMSAFLREDEK